VNIRELKSVLPPPKNAWYAPSGKPSAIDRAREPHGAVR
jgi:hypothetical protein